MGDNNIAIKFHRLLIARLNALWQYKGFVIGMVWREFRGRYLGSLLGSIWSILGPMSMIFIYTVIFSKIMRARIAGVDDNMAFGMFLCAGILPWGFFSELLSRCPSIFIEQANLLKKVNFPRITLPVVLFFSSAINFAIIFIVFLFFLLITGRFPGWAILAFLPLLAIQQTIALGIGMILGVLNVFFRDVGQFLAIVLQFWFWFTPIIYPATILPESIGSLLKFNPITQLILAYQQIILYGKWPDWTQFWPHILIALTALIVGSFVFQRLSGDIVDEL